MKKNKDIKKIVLCAMYTAVLFLQELILSVIPNVQFTFLLVMIFGAVLGMKWGSFVVVVHTIADNILWGSLTVHTFIPMLIGLEFTLLLGCISKYKKPWIVVMNGIFASISYCLIFIPFQVFVLNVDFLVYLLSDIPFEIILIVSTIITLIWFYYPLKKLVQKQWDSVNNN